MEYKFTSRSVEDTLTLAQNIESEKFPNMVICLVGELGSGKTVFTKGFAAALGIEDTITSPTFNIIKEYQSGELPLYHMDVYRLEDASADDIGLDEYFNGDGVSVVEWSQFIDDELPNEYLIIHIIKDEQNDDQRKIVIEAKGERYQELLAEL